MMLIKQRPKQLQHYTRVHLTLDLRLSRIAGPFVMMNAEVFSGLTGPAVQNRCSFGTQLFHLREENFGFRRRR